MHSEDVKIADIVGEYLQINKRKKGKKVEVESRKGKENEKIAYMLPPPLKSVF